MSACRRVGRSPEVEEAITVSGAAARLAAASSARLSCSRSGALSCTNAAPVTASSGVATWVRTPSGGSGTWVSRAYARRALASTSPTARGASGAGSERRTSQPLRRKRAAQPPPITPPPRSATAERSAMPRERQLLAHLARAEHAHVHRLEDRHRALDELRVGGEHAAREVQVVLQPDPHVAARQRGERDVRQLHAADGEGREDRAGRQPGD